MRFRPCIDIHDGKVKQLVGGSLTSRPVENYVAEQSADYYARIYQKDNLFGGHIILLNPAGSLAYEKDVKQARLALSVWPKGFQIGGGIRAQTAADFLDMGASHVIVTSYAFSGGQIQYENLERLVREIGREHIVLDVSCKKMPDEYEQEYRIVTDRWQTYTQVAVTGKTLRELAAFCDEFLIHAVDVEGKCSGIERDLARLLGQNPVRPMTYAGGVAELEDLNLLSELGDGKLDVTIGSALDLFGGKLAYRKVQERIRELAGGR